MWLPWLHKTSLVYERFDRSLKLTEKACSKSLKAPLQVFTQCAELSGIQSDHIIQSRNRAKAFKTVQHKQLLCMYVLDEYVPSLPVLEHLFIHHSTGMLSLLTVRMMFILILASPWSIHCMH
jgi:hypothetical protein